MLSMMRNVTLYLKDFALIHVCSGVTTVCRNKYLPITYGNISTSLSNRI